MYATFSTKIRNFFVVFTMLTILALALPRPVAAADANWSVEIVSVKANESVTIRTHNFPANRTWNARMDKSGNAGIDGIVAGTTTSEKGGSFEATYTIPAELKGVATITIRMESTTGGYWAYNWFNNRSSGGIPVTGDETETPSIRFLGVKANDSVVVEASDFPANTRIMVRVGPFQTFFRDYVVTQYVNSGNGTPFRFTVKLPAEVKDVNMITVRLDSDNGKYAYNAFKNVDSGTVNPTPTPTVPASATCQIVSVTPGRTTTHADIDIVWTIKNVSGKTWDKDSVDYKFVSGDKLYKRAATYDLPQTVKNGETVRIVVDAIAPSTAGVYNMNWALVSGSTTLCNLPLTLTVR